MSIQGAGTWTLKAQVEGAHNSRDWRDGLAGRGSVRVCLNSTAGVAGELS